MGFSFRYCLSVFSSSVTVIPSSCVNFTNAPPSRSLGRTFVTVSGNFSGRARFMILDGSARAKSGWLTFLRDSANSLSGLRKGMRLNHWSFKGKTPGPWSVWMPCNFQRDAHCQRKVFLHSVLSQCGRCHCRRPRMIPSSCLRGLLAWQFLVANHW